MTGLHVGVDASCWRNTRGYGRYARALLTTLAGVSDDTSLTLVFDGDIPGDLPPGVRSKVVGCRIATASAAAANGRRSIPDMVRMSRGLADSSFDALLFPSIYSYVPVLSRAKKIVVVHDVIAETYPKLTVPRITSRLFWRTKVAVGLHQASAVVTVSEYSKQGIVRTFGISSDRVFVVLEASDPVFRRLSHPGLPLVLRERGVPESARIVAYIGGFGPHKNVPALINSFARVAREPGCADMVLVLVGEYKKEVFHSEAGRLQEQVRNLGITERVVFTGYLADEDVVRLLNRACVLALPSLMEGFGLPALEAAACGCPVIATTESPLPQILGEAAVFVGPKDPDGLTRALWDVVSNGDLRKRMGEEGVKASVRYSWARSAQQMHEIIHKVVAA